MRRSRIRSQRFYAPKEQRLDERSEARLDPNAYRTRTAASRDERSSSGRLCRNGWIALRPVERRWASNPAPRDPLFQCSNDSPRGTLRLPLGRATTGPPPSLLRILIAQRRSFSAGTCFFVGSFPAGARYCVRAFGLSSAKAPPSFAGCFVGSVTTKAAPCPGMLRAVMVPPWRSTTLRQMASPIPVPS